MWAQREGMNVEPMHEECLEKDLDDTGGGVADAVPFQDRPGKSFQELLGTSSRAELEALVQKAAEDPAVAYELQRRPRETLFKLIGLKVPDHIGVQVLAEKPDQFYLVLPKVK